MSHQDLQAVQFIENQTFTIPWSVRAFQYELSNKNTILKTAVFREKLVGYICIRTILDLTHILKLVVIPGFRRMGIASMLFRETLSELRELRPDIESITLEVRELNAAAREMYKKFGFTISGRRAGYYQKPYEDAVIMEMKIGEK
jgi:ribosomal-protein-alanine N-acetyltransferase